MVAARFTVTRGVQTASCDVEISLEDTTSSWWNGLVERIPGVNVGPAVNGIHRAELEPISDDTAEGILKQAGKLDGFLIQGGGVDIYGSAEATNCIFEARPDTLYPIRLMAGASFVGDAIVVDGKGRHNPGGYDPALRAPSSAISQGGHLELYRSEVKGTVDGLKGPNVLWDSLVHGLLRSVGSSGATSHNDAVQYVGGQSETTCSIRGNTLRPYNPDTGFVGNAAIMFSIKKGAMETIEVANNIFDGGNYTVQYGGDSVNGAVHHNVYVRRSAPVQTPRYGAVTAIGSSLEFDRETNIWSDTLSPVR